MALVNPVDPSRERVSACPVHFLWDGRGKARILVRAGFLGLLAAGMLFTAASLVRLEALAPIALGLALASATSWVLGQLGTLATTRARRG
jgi:hypothetical protein